VRFDPLHARRSCRRVDDRQRRSGAWNHHGSAEREWRGRRVPVAAQPILSAPASIPFPNATNRFWPDHLHPEHLHTGTADLRVSRLPITPMAPATDTTFATVAPFSATTIPAGKSIDVNLKFSPTAAGTFTASLAIASDDPNRPSFPVSLRRNCNGPSGSNRPGARSGSRVRNVCGSACGCHYQADQSQRLHGKVRLRHT